MAAMWELIKYEKVLRHLISEALELGDKIKKIEGPAQAEIIRYDAILKQIQACKELIKLLNEWYAKRKSEFESQPREIVRLREFIGITPNDETEYEEEDNESFTSGSGGEFCINPNIPNEDEHYVVDNTETEPYSENSHDGRNYDEC